MYILFEESFYMHAPTIFAMMTKYGHSLYVLYIFSKYVLESLFLFLTLVIMFL